MVFGSRHAFRWRTYLTKYVKFPLQKGFDCLVNFLFVLWDQKCCNVTNIKYASCPREQMMASNVSILDTEVAQAIVLLGIEGRLVEVVGRLGGPGHIQKAR